MDADLLVSVPSYNFLTFTLLAGLDLHLAAIDQTGLDIEGPAGHFDERLAFREADGAVAAFGSEERLEIVPDFRIDVQRPGDCVITDSRERLEQAVA